MLGDLIFAEPKALIGFAGRRVIEQTLQEQLPDDFQTAEYLLHHGLLDLIVPRSFLKQALSETITLYKEAPLKNCGKIPYGEHGPLTGVKEEQLRRFWKNSSDSKNVSLVKEFEFVLKSFGNTQQIQNIETGIVEKAFTLACAADTNWLNPSFEEFKVRTIFKSTIVQ
jgi:acetyl-CoA carboxylase carboxyl transferase subunit beta